MDRTLPTLPKGGALGQSSSFAKYLVRLMLVNYFSLLRSEKPMIGTWFRIQNVFTWYKKAENMTTSLSNMSWCKAEVALKTAQIQEIISFTVSFLLISLRFCKNLPLFLSLFFQKTSFCEMLIWLQGLLLSPCSVL